MKHDRLLEGREYSVICVCVQEHLDPSLDPSTVPDPVLAVIAEVALICLAEEPSTRPHMREVVQFLQPAAAFREEAGATVRAAKPCAWPKRALRLCYRTVCQGVWYRGD